MGWNKRSKIYLYTVIPVSFFALLTYIAIGYALWQTFVEQSKGRNFTIFDPTNPIHLIMVSSTRGNEPGNLKGETLGGFSKRGIQDNEDRRVQLDNVCIDDGRVRRRFKLLSSTKVMNCAILAASLTLFCFHFSSQITSNQCLNQWTRTPTLSRALMI